MAGRLIYLMGPSGSGKDTVLLGLSERLGEGAYLAPRLVTRAVTPSEPHCISVSMSDFEHLESGGRLAMAWRANGLAYGVFSDINNRLLAGCNVLLNGSRAYFSEARRRYADLLPVLLTVDPQLLEQRLKDRGRETAEQIRQRLDRNAQFSEPLDVRGDRAEVLVVDNSNAVDHTIQVLADHLHQHQTGGRSGLPDINYHRRSA